MDLVNGKQSNSLLTNSAQASYKNTINSLLSKSITAGQQPSTISKPEGKLSSEDILGKLTSGNVTNDTYHILLDLQGQYGALTSDESKAKLAKLNGIIEGIKANHKIPEDGNILNTNQETQDFYAKNYLYGQSTDIQEKYYPLLFAN